MANPRIIPKKSVQSLKVPLTSDLQNGEICINHADKKLYAKHPSTGAIQEIGGMSVHSHDELYSPDSSQLLELQNNGNITITVGGITKTFTFPNVSGTLATLSNVTGGSQGYEVRHVYINPYSYTGTAVDGTSESASNWTITRLEILNAGTTTKTSAIGQWSNKTSLSYS
jgi:hypothetical protein